MLKNTVAYFISPHGFGHAARACAVMNSLYSCDRSIQFEIFTQVPIWFLESSLDSPFTYHNLLTDIGMVQHTPLHEDLPGTIQALESFLTFENRQIDQLASLLQQLSCHVVICDISPLGIAVGKASGLPVILIENFTWDWIYAGYLVEEMRFNKFIPQLKSLFASADIHIQTRPVCDYAQSASLIVNPVSRTPRLSPAEVRKLLNLSPSSRIVLISMGGFQSQFHFLDRLALLKGITFIVPGGSSHYETRANLVLLPHQSRYYHPDLLYASDAVISKAGYSTIAEAYHAGIPFGYITRPQFRESAILTHFIQEEMVGIEIAGNSYQSGHWIDQVPSLLERSRIARQEENGAVQIARYLLHS